jgi:hypothetical protein
MREFTLGYEGPDHHHLTAVASHYVGPKVDDGHYVAFCKIEEEWWKFNVRECAQVEEEIFQDNFPVREESDQTSTFLIHSKTEWKQTPFSGRRR